MKLNLFLLFICVGIVIVMTIYISQPTTPRIRNVPVSTDQQIVSYPKAPDFSFQTLSEQELSLSDFEGKTIILNFWASWCTPCVKEFPLLLELAEKEYKNIVLIAVTVDAEKDNIYRFISDLGDVSQSRIEQKNVFIAWDPSKKISQDLFQTMRYPETYIIAPDQTLRKKIIGADTDFSSDDFIEDMKQSVY